MGAMHKETISFRCLFPDVAKACKRQGIFSLTELADRLYQHNSIQLSKTQIYTCLENMLSRGTLSPWNKEKSCYQKFAGEIGKVLGRHPRYLFGRSAELISKIKRTRKPKAILKKEECQPLLLEEHAPLKVAFNVADPSTPLSLLEEPDLNEALNHTVALLPPIQRFVLAMHRGLGATRQPSSHPKIAPLLSLSTQRLSQIELKALQTLLKWEKNGGPPKNHVVEPWTYPFRDPLEGVQPVYIPLRPYWDVLALTPQRRQDQWIQQLQNS